MDPTYQWQELRGARHKSQNLAKISKDGPTTIGRSAMQALQLIDDADLFVDEKLHGDAHLAPRSGVDRYSSSLNSWVIRQ